MTWDPTDYKDMLDDDWNHIHQDILRAVDKFWPATNPLASQILSNLQRNKPSLYASILNRLDYLIQIKASKKEVANDIMKNFYLTPAARNREYMKTKKLKHMKTYKDIRTALFDLGYTLKDVKFREGSSVGKVTLHMNDGKEFNFKRKTIRDDWKYLAENFDENSKKEKYLSESLNEFLKNKNINE